MVVLDNKQKSKKKVNRCKVCRKKLGLVAMTCKCNKMFCLAHLPPEEHECTFDHKNEATKQLTEKLQKVESDKFVKI